jgi:hypothetical protein
MTATDIISVADAPESASPVEAVASGLEAAAAQIPGRELARQRRAIIAGELKGLVAEDRAAPAR